MNNPPTGHDPAGDESSERGPDDWQPYGQDAAYWDPYALPPVGYQPSLPPNGYPGYYGYPGVYQAPSNSGKAVTSLVCGIISICTGFLCCALGLPTAVAAVVLGVVARREIADSAGYERGEGMAITGMITGGIGAVLSVFWIGLMLVL